MREVMEVQLASKRRLNSHGMVHVNLVSTFDKDKSLAVVADRVRNKRALSHGNVTKAGHR